MKRHWSHWLGLHGRCHPARCLTSADYCNRLESEWRMQDYLNSRKDLT